MSVYHVDGFLLTPGSAWGRFYMFANKFYTLFSSLSASPCCIEIYHLCNIYVCYILFFIVTPLTALLLLPDLIFLTDLYWTFYSPGFSNVSMGLFYLSSYICTPLHCPPNFMTSAIVSSMYSSTSLSCKYLLLHRTTCYCYLYKTCGYTMQS